MTEISAVIGANWGDEGKGRTTAGLCSVHGGKPPVVVMTNGGCQRGHTVVRGGARHVFRHFGSGTLEGSPTYFPATYYVNPMEFAKELGELEALGVSPECLMSERCLMQLPSDVFVCQALERSRGGGKHGSCGWGIWETVLRNGYWPISVDDFAKLDRAGRASLCREAMERQIRERLKDGIGPDEKALAETFMSDGFLRHFSDDFDVMRSMSKVLPMEDLLSEGRGLVFENSQGLLLDPEYSGDRIHSTPSSTGLNGVKLCLEKSCGANFDPFAQIGSLDAFYVSRTYLTRHGAGPFPEAVDGLKFEDLTNVPNEWQDSIRFGLFTEASEKALLGRIEKDFAAFPAAVKSKKLVLTHADQLEPPPLLEKTAFSVVGSP